ncbi:hypothetical protein ABFX02_12G047200 [Erythranthe guttata]
MMEEAKARWLRPNEIHAILYNHKCFTVHVKPMNLPKSGAFLLFDRKMLRNFRKDGHNWKKKKDGKTVKEAHEHLKVQIEELEKYGVKTAILAKIWVKSENIKILKKQGSDPRPSFSANYGTPVPYPEVAQ